MVKPLINLRLAPMRRLSKRGQRYPWFFHVKTIWLFTFSDLKTIVIPKTTFGMLNAVVLAVRPEQQLAGRQVLKPADILVRIPLVAFWVWINLLPFAIDNQRQPAAILEDKHNKPWRPLPSGRMTAARAKMLMWCLYPFAFGVSVWLGGTRQCLGLMVLGYGYNDLDLADWHWVARNVVNGLGFCAFASGALEVALGRQLTLGDELMLKWLLVIASVVSSTVQTQDMADQEGDRMRGRRSLPLSIGDGVARWATAAAMLCWSWFCPRYWDLTGGPAVLVGWLGCLVACRTVVLRTVDADKATFRVWNGWMACLYALPLLAAWRP